MIHRLGDALQFKDGIFLIDKDGSAYRLSRLVEGLIGEPEDTSYHDAKPDNALAILDKAKAELPASQYLEFRRAWEQNIQRRWPAVNPRCFETWQDALEHQRGRYHSHRPWALEFLCAVPCATKAEEWFEWCFAEFLKRLALPDGFRFGSPQYWVDCLQEFRCWTGPTARRFLYALDQPKDPLTLDRVSGLLWPVRALSSPDRTCIALTFLTRERARCAQLGRQLRVAHIAHFEDQKRHIAGLPEGATLLRVFG